MKSIFLFLSILFISGCSINPGYLNSKPDLSKLTPQKSTLGDVQNSLGDPATSKMKLNNSIVYRYYYKTPDAAVDQAKMIQGDYTEGCKNCGQIVTTFQWKQGAPLKDFLLTGIAMSDTQLQSQTNIAFMLLQQQKFPQAYAILLKAANNNFLPAEHTLGLMYTNGDGTQQDYKKAFYWFSRAASAGYPPALYDLGAMYKNGEGVMRNTNTAKALYKQSADLGYIMAIKELIKIYSAEGDLTQADYWIQKYQATMP